MNDVKKNIAYNLAYQILAIVLPLITAPYLSRVIGAEGVGIYSFSHSMALYFTYITLLGLTNYGNRAIAAVQDDYEERSRLFCEIYCMQLICFAVSISAYLIYTFFFSLDKMAALIMTCTVVSSVFNINWFFFGMEKFKLTVVRNSVIKVLTVIAIFVFFRDRNDIYVYVGIMSLGFLASQMYLWPFLKSMVRIQRPKLKNVVAHFKPNLILFIPVIAISIYNIMDKVFLGYMSTMEQVGYYENAERIITVTVATIAAIGTVMLPRISALVAENKADESKQYLDKTMLVVLAYGNAVMFGVFAVAKEFSVVYYGEDFIQTGVVMCYLAVTVVFRGCANVVRTQYLIPNKKDTVYLISVILGAIVNLIINLLLIPRLHAVGAAIGTICAETVVCMYQILCVRHALSLVKYVKWEFVFAMMGVVMFLCIHFMPVPENDILALGLHVTVGAAIYIFLAGLYIIKREKFNIVDMKKKR